ncbi:hypothetical protein [Pseudonocardia oroxyli]|uniref:Uncharacterized protein n=1 Tax=Pseudonocardia oroxyli TaxID=366584 RepID=A0A1G7ZCC3_PSEOR|nr:hypothetical protein [Pseudonocardia oroxyli]SDH06348.1 hypothetical protein SAMN05216377_11896 [Pseudonocardia oroxyli]
MTSTRRLLPSGRRLLLVGAGAGVVVVLLVLTLLMTVLAPGHATFEQPFASDSTWNTPIAADAGVDPNSDRLITGVTYERMLHAGMAEFGLPLYRADADTPRHTVTCTIDEEWGGCPFDGVEVPIPDDARPQYGSDGAMVVVDEATGKNYEFWQARRTATGWVTSFGAITDLDGSGWQGQATGSGASRLAGVIRLSEIEAGEIPHALALQSYNVCKDVFRAPALKTDGRSGRPDCLPEGARLQLDPTLDVAALPGLTPAARAVAEAMQRYGGYVMDVSAAPLSVGFERAPDAGPSEPGAVYRAAGMRWDYDGMEQIPWDRLRVLA